MTKKELVDAIMESMPAQNGRGGATRLHVESILEAYANVAAAELLGGGEITIQGIGKLKTVASKARTGRNPRTGQPLEIPAGRRLVVSSFRDFREALKG